MLLSQAHMVPWGNREEEVSARAEEEGVRRGEPGRKGEREEGSQVRANESTSALSQKEVGRKR